MSLDERFQAAVEIVQKLPKEGKVVGGEWVLTPLLVSGPVSSSNDQKLKFYSLYKQATIGDVNTERPGFLNFVERAKW